MRTSSIVAAALTGLSLVSGAPFAKRQYSSTGAATDIVVLQYALTLEHLEAFFYKQALAKFSESDFTSAGFGSNVRAEIVEIGSQEATHVTFLESVLTSLNVTPTAACSYDFPYTDVSGFLALAALIEGVGVSAYLGAAADITSKTYLTAAGAILTVEARHTTYIREQIGEDPVPIAFDTPLDFDEVYSLASQFITSCPSTNPTLPVKAFPVLAATAVGKAVPQGMVKLTPANATSIAGNTQLYAAFIGLTGTQFGIYNKQSMTVEIPYNAAGQTYVVLTTSNSTVTDDNIVAGPGVLNVLTGPEL